MAIYADLIGVLSTFQIKYEQSTKLIEKVNNFQMFFPCVGLWDGLTETGAEELWKILSNESIILSEISSKWLRNDASEALEMRILFKRAADKSCIEHNSNSE